MFVPGAMMVPGASWVAVTVAVAVALFDAALAGDDATATAAAVAGFSSDLTSGVTSGLSSDLDSASSGLSSGLASSRSIASHGSSSGISTESTFTSSWPSWAVLPPLSEASLNFTEAELPSSLSTSSSFSLLLATDSSPSFFTVASTWGRVSAGPMTISGTLGGCSPRSSHDVPFALMIEAGWTEGRNANMQTDERREDDENVGGQCDAFGEGFGGDFGERFVAISGCFYGQDIASARHFLVFVYDSLLPLY